jgi:hypothetical protein
LEATQVGCLAVNPPRPYTARDVSASKDFLKTVSNDGRSRVCRRIRWERGNARALSRIGPRCLKVRITGINRAHLLQLQLTYSSPKTTGVLRFLSG